MPLEYIHALPMIALFIWAYMSAWFVIALIRARNDMVDIAWGIGFFVATAIGLTLSSNPSRSAFVALLMILVWGGRLSLHIYRRNQGKPEDFRYAAWRKEWGKWLYIRSYLQIFILQGLLLLGVATPALVAATSAQEVATPYLVIGFSVWLFGFIFESVADAQLRRFVSNENNKGKLIHEGLWNYSRHPNYFGEVTQWWGLGIIALGIPNGYIGLVGPVLITFLIVKVSGVPLLEKKYDHNTEYQRYKKRTSMLIPLPPRKGQHS